MNKIQTLDALAAECAAWRREGKTVVWTNGCFDLLHAGHTRALAAARALGDVLVVGLNSDASVRRLKGNDRPICNQDDRAETLAALEAVDRVVTFDSQTCEHEIEAIKPAVWTKSGDYTPDSLNQLERRAVEENGGRIVITPLIPGVSTTLLVKKIQRLNPEIIISAACTLVRNRAGDMLMVATRYMDGVKWSPPGGGHHHGETLPETARRETLEETGLEVTVGPFLGIIERIETRVDFHLSLAVFAASLPEGESGEVLTAPRDAAIEAVAWFSQERMRTEEGTVVGRRIWLDHAWHKGEWPGYSYLGPGEE
ncbi:MAG: adenylyltransferase/cytidyltransferase family protein [Planctomycetaceae bacterium]|nr:adenylyltransferase/cytidyltransferase family protein [Planctomycetaceae bacterium]